MKRRTHKLLATLLALEVISFGVLHFTYNVPTTGAEVNLPSYMAWDEASETLGLKPSTKLTYEELGKTLRKNGMQGYEAVLDVDRSLLGIKAAENGMVIDARGFRKTEEVTEADLNVLVLGDSVAFGTLQGHTMPDFMQAAIAEQLPQLRVNIVNGALQGASSADIQKRLPVIDKALKPDVVMVYLGAEDLYKKRPMAYGLPSYTLTLLGQLLPNSFFKTAELPVLSSITKFRMKMHTPASVKNIAAITQHYNELGAKVILVSPLMLAGAANPSPLSADKIESGTPYWTDNSEFLAVAHQALTSSLENVAANNGADFVNAQDWLNITQDNQNALYDNIHLSSSGAHAFAQYLTLPLRAAVEQQHQRMTLTDEEKNQAVSGL